MSKIDLYSQLKEIKELYEECLKIIDELIKLEEEDE